MACTVRSYTTESAHKVTPDTPVSAPTHTHACEPRPHARTSLTPEHAHALTPEPPTPEPPPRRAAARALVHRRRKCAPVSGSHAPKPTHARRRPPSSRGPCPRRHRCPRPRVHALCKPAAPAGAAVSGALKGGKGAGAACSRAQREAHGTQRRGSSLPRLPPDSSRPPRPVSARRVSICAGVMEGGSPTGGT